MQVTMSKNEKIIYDILINDLNIVDALNIVSRYAVLTTIRINEEKRTEEIKELMQQKRARKPKSKNNIPPSEAALLKADAALLLAERENSYKGSPITKEEFLEAFGQRMEDMRDDY